MTIAFFERIYNIKEHYGISSTTYILIGLAIITFLGNYISIFIPITYHLSLLLLVISILYLFFSKTKLKRILYTRQPIHPISILAGTFLFIIAIIKSSGLSEIQDELEFFLPLVRWIENYPLIKGTALFHDRMGYNSAFFLSNTIFSWTKFFSGGLYDINSYLYLVINFHLLKSFNHILISKGNINFFHYFNTAALIVLFRSQLTSLDPDYPHIFIGIYILSLIIKELEIKKQKPSTLSSHCIVVLILSCYLLTVKFTGIFFGLFVLIYLHKQAPKTWLKTIGITTFFITGWLIRNYYMTGYIIYPALSLDSLNPDWKVPYEIAYNNYLYVSEHAKTMTDRHALFYNGTSTLNISNWLPNWLKVHGSINITANILAVLLPISLLITIPVLYKIRNKKHYILVFSIALLYFFFWFIKYPDPRFGWSWLLFIITFLTYQFIDYFIPKFKRILAFTIIILAITSITRSTFKTIKESPTFYTYLVKPSEVKAITEYKTKAIGKINIIVSKNQYCGGATPPCMPSYYDSLNIQMRGNTIYDGFKVGDPILSK